MASNVTPFPLGRTLATLRLRPAQVIDFESMRRGRALRVEASRVSTVETLEWMLQEARGGRLGEMIAVFSRQPGEGQVAAITGSYRADRRLASQAIDALAKALNEGR